MRLHAAAQRRYRDKAPPPAAASRQVTAQTVIGLVRSLRGLIERLCWQPGGTEWADYTTDNNYTAEAAASKRELVTGMLRGRAAPHRVGPGRQHGRVQPRGARGGASTSCRSTSTRRQSSATIAGCGRKGSAGSCRSGWTSPTPRRRWAGPTASAFRWSSAARPTRSWRWPWFTISPSATICRSSGSPPILARLGRTLVIEFVPKSDSQVQRMLRSRPDIFPRYTREGFEAAFRPSFRIEDARPVAGSERLLYLMTTGARP